MSVFKASLVVLGLVVLSSVSAQAKSASVPASVAASGLEGRLSTGPVFLGDAAVLSTGSYYDWARGRDGFGYCYQWTNEGYVLNGGQPVADSLCEQNRPSYFDWSRGQDGYGYCYRFTPYGVVMNQGQPTPNYSCEQHQPSHYSWGRGQDGYTYCYQYTPNGIPMNQGRPMPISSCQ